MGFNRFSVLLAARLLLIFAGLAAVGLLLLSPGYHAATLLVGAITALLILEVFRFVSRTNHELARFLDAVRYADFGQRFQFTTSDAGFDDLGETLTGIMDRFREDRTAHEIEARHLRALLEHVPVPLLSLHSDGAVTVWNNAARRLFGNNHVARVADLNQFGDAFFTHVTTIRAGQKLLTTFEVDGLQQQLSLAAAEMAIDAKTETLISLQNIQSELDSAQLTAWQDLVRVLTHEIMNSITPVTSLAKTAVDLVDDARSRVAGQPEVVEELADARDAVETVARRSDGLMSFVSTYRQLTRPPEPEKSRFPINDLLEDVRRIVIQEWEAGENALTLQVDPKSLELEADRRLVEQILINLLNNAHQAVGERDDGQVEVASRLNQRGRVVVEVADNGPGVPAEIGDRIFVPFFTTRREGSGVGLALSRQIMIAHGGSISFTNDPNSGARFTLVF